MKHVLFTTTALVVLGSTSAFADVTWSGSADLSYNDGNMDSAEGSLPDGVNLDVDLDVTLSNAGGFSATLSGAMEGGADAGDLNLKAEDFAVSTPVASINFGEVVEAANSAYSDISGMEGLGDDEFTGNGSAVLITASAGGMSVGYSDDSAMEGDDDMSSFGISGDLGGVSFGIGSKGDDWGISASGSALGGNISVASEEVSDESETGVEVTVPLGDMSVTVSATDGDDWEAGVSTSLAGASITASINDDEQSEFGLSTSIAGGFTLTVAYESGTEADSEDGNGTQVALEYALSDTASLTVSYNEDMDGDDDDDYDAGTSASLGFKF